MKQSSLDSGACKGQKPTHARFPNLGALALAAAFSGASALGLFLHFGAGAASLQTSPGSSPAHTLVTSVNEPPREVRRKPASSEPAPMASAVPIAGGAVRSRPLPPDSPPRVDSAKVARDPEFDRAQRVRLVALGEERLHTLERKAESLSEVERAALAFRMDRMRGQLAELRARQP